MNKLSESTFKTRQKLPTSVQQSERTGGKLKEPKETDLSQSMSGGRPEKVSPKKRIE